MKEESQDDIKFGKEADKKIRRGSNHVLVYDFTLQEAS